jgi:YD repeat-containing protein
MDRPVHTTTIGPAMQQAGATGIVPHQTGVDSLYVATDYDDEGLPLEIRRWVSPDTARINVLSTRYTYDAAGRKKTETEHGEGLELTTYLYDLGGNATGVITPRGDTITSQYDVMGRMVRRVVPEKRYAMSCPSQTNPCQNPYPHHPNGSSGSLVIPEEWTTFRFDPDGNMVYAENADAIVTRGYYRTGRSGPTPSPSAPWKGWTSPRTGTGWPTPTTWRGRSRPCSTPPTWPRTRRSSRTNTRTTR